MNRALLARIAKLEAARRGTKPDGDVFGLDPEQAKAAALAWLRCRRVGVAPMPPDDFGAPQRESFARFCEAAEGLDGPI